MKIYKILHLIFITGITVIYCKSDPIIQYINYYQKEETVMNGDRCPLYPTCSQYFKEMYKENKVLSFFLTLERMFIREIGNLQEKFLKVPEQLSSSRVRYYDPVENSFKKPSFLQSDF